MSFHLPTCICRQFLCKAVWAMYAQQYCLHGIDQDLHSVGNLPF